MPLRNNKKKNKKKDNIFYSTIKLKHPETFTLMTLIFINF